MKKFFFSTMFCVVLSATDPLFAMDYEQPEGSKKTTKLESIEFKKTEEFFSPFDLCKNNIYTLNKASISSIMKTSYPSDWYPLIPGGPKRGPNAGSYTFLIGEKQFELYIYDQSKENSHHSLEFFPELYYEMKPPQGNLCGQMVLSPYLTTKGNHSIRELTLSSEDPMFAKGVQVRDNEESQ